MKRSMLPAIAICLIATTAQASYWLDITNSKFFEIRSEMRDSNDYKRTKMCQELIESTVDMNGKLQLMDRKANMLIDLDSSSIASMPDVELELKDTDQAMDIKEGQMVYFTGSIDECRYIPLTGTLHIHVRRGVLHKHL